MAQMRAMASEFRGHVDEMVRQSELDDVKKQLEGSAGFDLKDLDPTKQIRSHIEEGMAEGEKAIAEAKANLDNPLAEPESAPQVAAEEPQQIAAEPAAEQTPVVAEAPPAAEGEPAEQKPAKAAAE
jgi:sec-independent protein translocase protein TatB